ncbi:hypothetical protein [Actinoplanes sp. GCM10030250]|uniref:hypothetical protein n=1 Tax=Actinoplanes sp. GCM10030250 TaxID=3273376 RepID=UPI0036224085
MEIAIAVLGLLAALVALVASIVQAAGERKNVPGHTLKRAGWLMGAAIVFAALSWTAYVVIPKALPGPSLAEIRDPAAGDRITRPQQVDIRLNGPAPRSLTFWLGYQNEKSGPFIVQAAQCMEAENRLDCGPLYVGHDEHDTAKFRIFVATADSYATAKLSAHGLSHQINSGDNVSYPVLPVGTKIVTEKGRVGLRQD